MPAPNIASLTPPSATNKYTFKPSRSGTRTPRTQAGHQADAGTAAPTSSVSQPVPASKAKEPSKRKAKTTSRNVAVDTEEEGKALTAVPKALHIQERKAKKTTVTSEPTKQPSVCGTRHTSARKNPIKHAREEA